ncbi:hypothetical protein, partial [Tsukamurella soli]|uniref:hypothetical protein n=1 Tax=Tsukamurella soli TaxID=644556 RepID=UPI0031EF7FD8
SDLFGAVLPWPVPPGEAADGDARARPARAVGALVVLDAGELALFVERGGKTVLTFTPDPAPAVAALARAPRGLGGLTIERIDGDPALSHPLAAAFLDAGFARTPKGLRLR